MITTLKKYIFFVSIILFSYGFSNQSEDPYVCKIIDSISYTRQPDVYSDYWRSHLECAFDNGLTLHISHNWECETQAEDAAVRFKKHFKSGKCGNLIFKRNFLETGTIVTSDPDELSEIKREIHQKYKNRKDIRVSYECRFRSMFTSMWTISIYVSEPFFMFSEDDSDIVIDKLISDKTKNQAYISVDSSSRSSFFTLVDFKEEFEDDGLWPFVSPTKNYVLELSNGKKWFRSEEWKNPWEGGSHIIVIGTKENPILINIDAIQQKSEINLLSGSAVSESCIQFSNDCGHCLQFFNEYIESKEKFEDTQDYIWRDFSG